ncbi:MAG: HepT-like ribonuclease domain-containing protein [Bacteroidota bacterium]
MKGSAGDLVRLLHIIDACQEILSYTSNVSKAEFSRNSMMRFACIKQLEIIGEAANHVTKETQNRYTNIEWRQIIGMRNIFVHEYFGVDDSIV